MTTLTPRQLKAIEALLSHASVAGSARACGVSRATLYRWLDDETFCDTLKKREAELLIGSSRQLATLTAQALDVLSVTLNEPMGKPAHKLRAAEVVLGKFVSLKDALSFEQRLSVLEKQRETR